MRLHVSIAGTSLFVAAFLSIAGAQQPAELKRDTPASLIAEAVEAKAIVIVAEESSPEDFFRQARLILSEQELKEHLLPLFIEECLAAVKVREILTPGYSSDLKVAYILDACGGASFIFREIRRPEERAAWTNEKEVAMKPSFTAPGTEWLLFLNPLNKDARREARQSHFEALQLKGLFTLNPPNVFHIAPPGKRKTGFKISAEDADPARSPYVVSRTFVEEFKTILSNPDVVKSGQLKLKNGLAKDVATRLTGR